MSVEPVRSVDNASLRADPAVGSSAAHEHHSGALGARFRSALPGSVGRLAVPLTAVAMVVTLVLVASARWDGWIGGADTQVTDNATIRADVTHLGSRVAGTVRSVAVGDYQHIRQGDLLVELDPTDFEVAVAQAEASVAGAQAILDNLANQMALQQATIAQSEAQLAASKAVEQRTALEASRQGDLLRRGLAGTAQKQEQASADHAKAAADVRAAAAANQGQQHQLAVLHGQEQQRRAELRAAMAALDAARLRLGYTRIVAPFDGVVGERKVQPGDYVNVGTNTVTLVPLPRVYVTANYKETQLTRVAPGQPVDISVDMFPGTVLHGHVAQVSPASGATYALLPPDNATGNFTKVVQRIPVRIDLDPAQPLLDKLRPGMSVETRIHVQEAPAEAGRAS